MSRNFWLIAVLVVLSMCVLCSLCATANFVGYRLLRANDQQLTASESPRLELGKALGGDEGQTLRLAGGIPPTLDPAVVQDFSSAEYIVHLFSGLVTLNEHLEIVPDLATHWEVSPDGRTYTFHLVPEANFADGRAITSEDVVYSIERACDPALGSPVALSYLDDIVGAVDYSGGEAEGIAGLEVIDEHTLSIQIDAPKAYFLAKLTYPTAFVVDREQIEREGASWPFQPNGSGPFTLQSVSGDEIVLERNDRYHGGLVSLERVEYILSGGLPITMYENDRLDIVEVGATEIERVLDPANPLYAEHQEMPELSVQYLGLNVNAPPFDDVKVRQAFAKAIDKEKIADLVLKGTAVPSRGILPVGMPDYDEDFQGLSYDPEAARQLLASSSYGRDGDLPDIVLTVTGTSMAMPPVVRAVVFMVEENLGIQVRVEQVEWPFFLRDLTESRYQMWSAGWVADYPDSQNFLDVLFHGQSAQNHTGYDSAIVNELLERARVEADATKRRDLYREAERTIVADSPWIPLTHSVSHVLVKPHVKGYHSSAGLYPWLKYISIDR